MHLPLLRELGSCVHLLTLQKVFGVMLPEDAQVSIFARGARHRLIRCAAADRVSRGRRPGGSAGALRSCSAHLGCATWPTRHAGRAAQPAAASGARRRPLPGVADRRLGDAAPVRAAVVDGQRD